MNSQSLTPQQEIRMQVIRSIIAGNDPELKKQVLALISEGWNPVDENLSTVSIFLHHISIVTYMLLCSRPALI